MATLNSTIKTYNLIGLFKADPKDFLKYIQSKSNQDIPQEITEIAQQRWEAKKNKNFTLADELRAKVSSLGYEIKDTREGFEILKK